MRTLSIHIRISLILKLILLIEAVVAFWGQQWLTAALTTGIILTTFFPLLIKKQFRINIPAEFELLAILFIFASLYLGEIRGYYSRFWWWDIVLHAASGVLMGIVGFLLVYVMNELRHIEFHMKAGFVALFAFFFSLGIGALWEIFEFTMDQVFDMNMQKEMLGDPSGLTDTMFDLIVDAIGSLVISLVGYGYLKSQIKESFLERWINEFIKRNPRFFSGDR